MDAETLAVFTKFLNTPKVKVDFEYRLYYNKQNGDPLFYSMEDNESGDFIVVTHEQYTEGRYDIRILNGKIEKLSESENWTKLVPSSTGTSTRADNVMIVDNNGSAKWKIKTYYRD